MEQWRTSRPRRSRIPDELWAAAAALSCRDGVSRTAAALHPDRGKLKRQMARETAARKKSPAFVELMAPACCGEVSRANHVAGVNCGTSAFLITHHSGKTSLQSVAQLFGGRLNDRSVGRMSRWRSPRETSFTSRVLLFRSGVSRKSDARPWLLLARFIVEIR